MKNGFLVLVVGVFGCFYNPLAYSEIFQWVDENGITHFSDTPPETEEFSEVEVQINSYESTTITNNSNYDYSGNHRVVMFSTDWCAYCDKAKDYFESNNIAYKEYNIEKSTNAKLKYDKLNAQGVPVILVGDKRMTGFNEAAFEKIYN